MRSEKPQPAAAAKSTNSKIDSIGAQATPACVGRFANREDLINSTNLFIFFDLVVGSWYYV